MTQISESTLFTSPEKKQDDLVLAKTIVKLTEQTLPHKDKTNKVKLKKANISDNARLVLSKRYLIKDRNRKPLETPEEMFWRVASYIAQADAQYAASESQIKHTAEKFYDSMINLQFLPNSPTFTGAGTKLGQLSACFVLPIEDDMTSILKTQMDMGLIHKSGGGTGFSFSRLRAKNDSVGTTGGISCGPIGFMQMYNDTTEQIKQGGTRRGANMGVLRIDHPDILEFISYKKQEGNLANFNISVGITADFWKALEENGEYNLISPRSGKITKTLKAQQVFAQIVENAWRNGEPGVIFLDHINAANPTPQLGEIESTNPCGEQPLLPYESCNLGSINLAKMIKHEDDKVTIDWDKLTKTIETAYHFMDNIIDVNRLPISEIIEMTKKTRKIGMGVMGFADLLYQLEIPYDSTEGINLGKEIMKFIQSETHRLSQEYVKTRGLFPAYSGSIWDKKGIPMHNAATTTVAPTGTLSIVASCSSGIEPNFALAYIKTVMDKDPLPEINPYFVRLAKKQGFYSEDLMKEILAKGSIQNIKEIPEAIKKIFVISSDISYEWHVKMQAAFQEGSDSSISKTINFPNSATKEEVAHTYKLAHKLKCKGLTVYRDGSRKEQILTVGDNKQEAEKAKEQSLLRIEPRKRPTVVHGYTYKTKTAYGNLYVTVNEDDKGEPFEVFAQMGKAGGFFAAKVEAISRLISLALRSGINVSQIIDQLKGIRGPSPIWTEEGTILSLPDAIAKVLEKHVNREQMTLNFEQNKKINHQETIKQTTIADMGVAPACPECGGILEMGEGCLKCRLCGFSKCG